MGTIGQCANARELAGGRGKEDSRAYLVGRWKIELCGEEQRGEDSYKTNGAMPKLWREMWWIIRVL